MLLREGGDEIDVFRFFDGAGGIDDTASGFEAGKGVGEDGGLDFGQLFDIGGLESPADINPAANHTGVRARHIEEDGIEGFMEFFRCGFAPIVDGNFVGSDAEAREVFLETGNAFFV